MKLQVIKDIECDKTGKFCDQGCDSCCNVAGDSQWVKFDGANYARGEECLAGGAELKQLRDENQSHRDFINEENEELTEALATVGELKELIEEMIPLAFPNGRVYTAQRAGEMIALRDRALSFIKEKG